MSAPGLQGLIGRARAALDVGRLDEAERAARGALAVDPAAEEGHALLARVHLQRGAHDEALRTAEAGIGATPDSEWLHRLRALALSAMGRGDEARAAADEAVRLAPDLAPAHYVRSVVLEAMKALPEARESAERAVELDPEDASYHAQLGDLCLARDPARAERHYRESLALDPERAATLNNLGVALNAQKRTRDAALAFRSAVILDPSLTVAKQNTHASVRKLAGGGTLFAVAIGVTQGARLLERIGRGASESLRWVALAVVLAGAAATWGIWFWRRTAGIRRLAETDPQLHAIYVRLEADRKAGRLRS